MSDVNRLIGEVATLQGSLEYYLRHGRPEDKPGEVTPQIIEKIEQLVGFDRTTPSGMLGCYAGMEAAKFLLDNFYVLLHNQGCLERVYRLHPNPTLLSKACRAHLWAKNQTHLDYDWLGMSMKALQLGGFSTLRDLQESFPDFKVENAPAPEISRMMLENTFKSIELFSNDPLSIHHGGKYFIVLLGKMIDDGESAWAIDFIDKHLDTLEQFAPVSYRRLDEPEGFTFKERLLVHLQNYLRCDRLLQRLAVVDEPSFNKVLSSPQTHDHIMWDIGARKGFELSAIPLDAATCKDLVTKALDCAMVEQQVMKDPLRLLDFARLEEAYLSAGHTSSAFMKVLSKRSYYKGAMKEAERLITDLSKVDADHSKILKLSQQYGTTSLDYVVMAAYANSQVLQDLIKNLKPLSCLMALRGYDSHVVFDLERTHVTALELKTVISHNEGNDSDLFTRWAEIGLFKTPESIREISKLSQEELKSFRKLLPRHFNEAELRSIPWVDHRIRESFFGQDLGL